MELKSNTHHKPRERREKKMHELYIEGLENLILKSFYNLDELKKLIEEEVGCEDTTLSWDHSTDLINDFDYLILGNIFNEKLVDDGIELYEDYSIKIFYAKVKNHFIITEVSYKKIYQ